MFHFLSEFFQFNYNNYIKKKLKIHTVSIHFYDGIYRFLNLYFYQNSRLLRRLLFILGSIIFVVGKSPMDIMELILV